MEVQIGMKVFFFSEQSHMSKKIYILGYFLHFLDDSGGS